MLALSLGCGRHPGGYRHLRLKLRVALSGHAATQRFVPPEHPAPHVAASAAVVRAQLEEQGAAAAPQPPSEEAAEALAAEEPAGPSVPSFAALAQTADSSGRGARLAKEARRLASDLADVLASPAAARRR